MKVILWNQIYPSPIIISKKTHTHTHSCTHTDTQTDTHNHTDTQTTHGHKHTNKTEKGTVQRGLCYMTKNFPQKIQKLVWQNQKWFTHCKKNKRVDTCTHTQTHRQTDTHTLKPSGTHTYIYYIKNISTQVKRQEIVISTKFRTWWIEKNEKSIALYQTFQCVTISWRNNTERNTLL